MLDNDPQSDELSCLVLIDGTLFDIVEVLIFFVTLFFILIG